MAELNDTNINGTLTINGVNIIDLFYPVGSIYLSVNNTNPGDFLGGTWVAWGSGRVVTGVNTSWSEFSTVEKTGGSRTVNIQHTHTGPSHYHSTPAHTLTTSEIPAHTHTRGTMEITGQFRVRPGDSGMNMIDTAYWGTNNPFVYSAKSGTNWGNVWDAWAETAATDLISFTASKNWTGATSSVGGGGSHAHGNTGSAGTGATGSALSSSQSILPPYITCYMWKRTA